MHIFVMRLNLADYVQIRETRLLPSHATAQ